MLSRRKMMTHTAALAAGAALLDGIESAVGQTQPATTPHDHHDHSSAPTGEPGRDYTPVVTPNGSTLPYKLVDGVKVFHLIAEPVKREFAPGLVVDCWGYNGQTPGPTIEAAEGDRVRFYVTNKLPEPTTVHWHGLILPNGMDGVSGLSHPPIKPGETFKYEFTLRQHGTHMYHPHFDEMTQIALGMTGMFIIHPRDPNARERVDRDFAIMLGEWLIPAGTTRPNPMEMNDFNVLTMNSKAFPGTEPLVVRQGQRVRIRLGNLGPMDHHPIHLHGYKFDVTGTDGGVIPRERRHPMATVLVAVGMTRDIEFVADKPGDWAMHCHMTHHVMNQMGHDVPNMIGVDPAGVDEKIRKLLPGYMTMGHDGMGGMAEMGMAVPHNSIPMVGAKGPHGLIDMGGMFTILKVRENLESYEDPGWYVNPPGTIASLASSEELRRDGIDARGAAQLSSEVTYTCPMHPEIVQSQPGRCPKCNMMLKEVRK